MTTITDEQLSQDCDDLDLRHGPTRLLACALYWRRKYFALAAQPAKPMFVELIAQHEGLAEELDAMDGPAWHDAPTGPGNWVMRIRNYYEVQTRLSEHEIEEFKSWGPENSRWFGPISPDTEGTK